MDSWVRERRLNPDDPEDDGQWRQALSRARIPARHWSARQELVKGDRRWLDESLAHPEKWAGKGYGFFINGPFNTGKSAAAALLAMEFVRRCHVVLWLSVREVPAVRFREGELGLLNDLLQRVDLLVLDDLGSERFRMESAAGAALEEVIRIIYDRNRSVILTSNKGWDEFEGVYAMAPALVSIVKRMVIPIALLDSWPNTPDLGIQ